LFVCRQTAPALGARRSLQPAGHPCHSNSCLPRSMRPAVQRSTAAQLPSARVTAVSGMAATTAEASADKAVCNAPTEAARKALFGVAEEQVGSRLRPGCLLCSQLLEGRHLVCAKLPVRHIL
jgi:hypothetical protein